MAPSFPKRTASTPSKLPYSARQSSIKRNTSILNFFQKTDAPVSRQPRITQFATKANDGSGGGRSKSLGSGLGSRRRQGEENGTESLFLEDPGFAEKLEDEKVLVRFDENGAPVKKRRAGSVSSDDLFGDGNGDDLDGLRGRSLTPEGEVDGNSDKRQKGDSSHVESEKRNGLKSSNISTTAKPKQSGPFIDESDSEEEDLGAFGDIEEVPEIPDEGNQSDRRRHPAVDIPPLVREATSNMENNEFANFDDLEESEFREEEFLEPLVDEETDQPLDPEMDDSITMDTPGESTSEGVAVCPICQTDLAGSNETEVSLHVNNCLDGVSRPNSSKEKEKPPATDRGLTGTERATIPRPAQRDPYAANTGRGTSAFSKLMAGNAEDRAWTAATASEVASRGKQAYQRTCPFYKVIQGFSICVDAFRYGAVEGCNAYFLSHFHSDHYMGLTAKWCHGPIYCSKVTGNLVRQQLKVDPKWVVDLEFEKTVEVPNTGGVQVTLIEANHCPGSALFLFEKQLGPDPLSRTQRVLHCGDFRASPAHAQHPLLRPETFDPVTGQRRYQKIDVCYLDTTYLSPKYSFPRQDDVVSACVDLCVSLDQDDGTAPASWDKGEKGGNGNVMSRFFSISGSQPSKTEPERPRGRLLVVIGTYSIGKERICLAIARALQCKIYATAAKKRVCECLEDAELLSLLTDDPLEAQIHMQTMFEIRAETLGDYLHSMKPAFSRVVGFRPTGWTYRPPAERMGDNPSVSTVLYSDHWNTAFSARDLVPQRGSTRESACYGVPYSEHSSFRELTMFCCALRIGRIIPTVNVGSAKSRERMKGWIDKWEGERKKHGEYKWQG
ncbi:repair protein PSO2 SNM1 [Aspergillus sclerotialis]|uniref:Repair protein PSO2 SNM1 n=1 Tax=Aspergillus sclerotialis TaxID=2070753 RepID=A0A3A2ZNT0_9EURO|nr:repair protein PSO2 SNM1 [Aspergillus sclerotialis]